MDGLSIRAIAAATGLADKTVQRDLKAGVVNDYTSPELSGDVIVEEPTHNPYRPEPATVGLKLKFRQ